MAVPAVELAGPGPGPRMGAAFRPLAPAAGCFGMARRLTIAVGVAMSVLVEAAAAAANVLCSGADRNTPGSDDDADGSVGGCGSGG